MMYILERCISWKDSPPSTFAGSSDNWICLLRSSTRRTLSQHHCRPRTIHIPCGNSFQRRVKYSQNVKTLRVEEIRPDPVKRYFVGKEKAASRKLLQKWSFRKFAQMDRDDVVVVILKIRWLRWHTTSPAPAAARGFFDLFKKLSRASTFPRRALLLF